MITHIRHVAHRGHTLWQHAGRMGWEIAPARFIRHLIRSQDMHEIPIKRVAALKPIATRLVHRDRVVAYRVETWAGKRYATEQQVREWLRWNGFDAAEVCSLFDLADTLPISATEARAVRALSAHGISA